ncbi:MAG: hypothetical protein E7344_00260 [Clostridiales bacterium]|nr:hypothetical protein [Clostridiales bacterium]
MEFVIEFVMELYMEAMMLLVPEKQFGKKMTRFLKVLCAVITFAIAMLVIIGASILIDPEAPADDKNAGIICLAIGGSLFVIHLLLFVFIMIKRKK